MSDSKNIDLHVGTTADTTGLDKTEDGVRRLKTESSRDLQAMTDKVRVTEFAFYDLDEALRTTERSSTRFNAGAQQVRRSTGNAAQSLYVFAQGFEDAQYGIRGVLNNIPQLVLAMGGTMGIAGAVSVAAVAFSQLYSWFGKTEQAADDLGDKIGEAAQSAGEVEAQKLEQFGATLEARTQAAIDLREQLQQTAAAEAKASTAALSNADRLRQAQQLINQVLGLQVDKYAELEAAQESQRKQRELAAQQAIAQEQARLATTQQELEDAKVRLQNAQQEKQNAEDRRAASVQALEDYRRERKELEALAKERLQQLYPGAGQFGPTDRARAAQEKLDSPAFSAQDTVLKKQIEEQTSALEKFDGEAGTLAKLNVRVQAAANKLADTRAAVETSIATIQSNLAAETLQASAASAVQKSQQLATSVTDALGQITTQNATVATQIAQAKSLAESGGAITADELPELQRLIVNLTGALQSGLATSNTQFQQTLDIVRGLQTKQRDFERTIAELQRGQ